ncbi:hypothetical protein SS1G_03327 [Sclerotinia sclerotiorum 1980 UF-70]|uniref:Spermatogenesis-associated protein 20-like TRX domain-containing protein n=2 Tax=Sclerotinia sclerotiorum (strain ATCC 18683 / 1980 / Ss-1) TaxID=665079 RepID=A7EDD7_SCLS1|nr:hypothetical protein SS1G_03327 [Sclerotinia sclerotiorum 1980 UF-70]APA10976.1 hypothetical protein sscle_07g057460 [Sclerotinia sclerotiorum 1980 UF-70]EDO00853.1 hypothetical protein SS1G_03327 [Sclerotinia sclerotiorum 1980 UF-70]
MAANLRGVGEGQGIGQALKNMLGKATTAVPEEKNDKVQLVNRAGESKSPYVRAHSSNPVAWQLWGDEAIDLARRENKLLFVSIGYSSCHWCHIMERESFENEEVAAILNSSFIPIKIDREERPDIDRIYMNFVQATTGSGGWPLNVFLTPSLEPVFGGTYWPGPSKTKAFEDQVDFLGILDKLSTVWSEQERRCRQDSAQILQQLKDFANEGTLSNRLGDAVDNIDIELLEEATQHFAKSFDKKNGGFGSAPKFPTPSKLAFLLRLSQFPQAVLDIVGIPDCENAKNIAITTLRKMARGGIHDHIGNGFARYSVTADWSLPHFEKMLYDNAQLLHIYLDAFLLSRDPEFLGVAYDIADYLTITLFHPQGGFYSSEDADSYYKAGDTEKREGAYYVWTKREFENILGTEHEPILSAFFNVTSHGNVAQENDPHDEFMDQNVLAISSTPSALANQFGMKEAEIIKVIKEGKAKLRKRREADRVKPDMDDKIIVSWNGIAIGALARASAVINGFDPVKAQDYLDAALKTAKFIKENLYDEKSKILYRIWREGRGDTQGFADDYAFLMEGLIDLYEATFDEKWLQWADELQQSQINFFYDTNKGGFFSTIASAPNVILRLKEGMDSAEPSTNGTSSSNLYRLSSILNDESYAKKANETVKSFESEMLQYPWLFPSFMPAIVASHLGVKSVVIHEVAGDTIAEKRVREFQKAPRGGLESLLLLDSSERNGQWLIERNSLLKDTGKSEKTKILICENGLCKEEDEVFFVDSGVKMESPNDGEGFKMAGLQGSLPNLGGDANKT